MSPPRYPPGYLLPEVPPFLGAVHVAFAEHRPLVLSPDAVWLTILAEVTQHVRLNAEELRDRLVRHECKKQLEIEVDFSLRERPDAIRELVPRFRELLAREIGEGRTRLFTCDFSTTTEVERMASEIMLQDTFSPYYEYATVCVCGIPEITLLGEIEDWKRIRERIDVIAELDLEFWTASLRPILDEFVRASQGAPNVAFFRDIYQPQDAFMVGKRRSGGRRASTRIFIPSDREATTPVIGFWKSLWDGVRSRVRVGSEVRASAPTVPRRRSARAA